MEFQIKIETERLFLREILREDAERLFEMDSNPIVHTYLGTDPVQTIEEVLEYITSIQQQYQLYDTGRLAVVEKSSGLLIGWAGIKFDTEGENDRKNYFDIGYRFVPQYWGMGYASEATKAILQYGFETLGIESIVGIVDERHLPSIKVLEKFGFEKESTFLDSSQNKSVWLELSKSKWDETHSRQN